MVSLAGPHVQVPSKNWATVTSRFLICLANLQMLAFSALALSYVPGFVPSHASHGKVGNGVCARGTLMTSTGPWRATDGAHAQASDGSSRARRARPSTSVDSACIFSARSVGHRRAIRDAVQCDATVNTSLGQGTGFRCRWIGNRRFAGASHISGTAGVAATARHQSVDGGIGKAWEAEETQAGRVYSAGGKG